MKLLLMVAHHTKTMAGDHGLEPAGDAIVMGGIRPLVGGPGSIRDPAKMPDCIA
jgi:hypothetical protein